MKKRAVLLLAALLAASACSGSGPSMSITGSKEPVSGNVVELPVKLSGVDIVKADGDTSGRTGHFHVFVDRKPVGEGEMIPKEKGVVHAAENPIRLHGLAVGAHRLTVVVGDGTHRRILPGLERRVSVTVGGPSVQASATQPAPGQPVTVDMKVEGFGLAPANGDSSGRTGHLHLFVDREPTPAGQPIPKEAGIVHTTETSIKVPGLAPGEHTVWVVAGDGNHVPLRPPVMAKVTVSVR